MVHAGDIPQERENQRGKLSKEEPNLDDIRTEVGEHGAQLSGCPGIEDL
jgi:hypothetical protein